MNRAEGALKQFCWAVIDGAVGFDVVAFGDGGRAVAEERGCCIGATTAGDNGRPPCGGTNAG